jgi:hypothetical protein
LLKRKGLVGQRDADKAGAAVRIPQRNTRRFLDRRGKQYQHTARKSTNPRSKGRAAAAISLDSRADLPVNPKRYTTLQDFCLQALASRGFGDSNTKSIQDLFLFRVRSRDHGNRKIPLDAIVVDPESTECRQGIRHGDRMRSFSQTPQNSRRMKGKCWQLNLLGRDVKPLLFNQLGSNSMKTNA